MTRNVSFRIEDKLFEEFSIICVKKKTNKADVIRKLIEEYTRKYGKNI
ncbi:MAG: hypothetical protein ISS36_00055 [Candidatus Aenigmarchaeota archaeon]|nr:hypothetical protein [Candidatus Aenigmarchaeota archaeon]